MDLFKFTCDTHFNISLRPDDISYLHRFIRYFFNLIVQLKESYRIKRRVTLYKAQTHFMKESYEAQRRILKRLLTTDSVGRQNAIELLTQEILRL